MDQNKLSLEPHHLGVPSGASKTISEPMVCSAQTVHQSSIKIVSLSQRNEKRLYMTHVTLEFHCVHPKQFLSQRYGQRKLCTYLLSRLALSPNEAKRVSTWASSPRSTIGCIQNDFWAYGTLAQIVQLFCTYTNTISKWTEMIFHITHVTLELH
jgi:hypothetical protein